MNKYRQVLLAAQRTKQLHNGAQPRVKAAGAKPSRIALNEVEQGLIQTKGGAQEEILCAVPPSPKESIKSAKKSKSAKN